MVANSPGILPKTALVGSKAIYYPFTIPKQVNEASTHIGVAGHEMIGGINASVGNAYASLQPRGPAKWLLSLFDSINTATAKSAQVSARNKAVFWDPFSNGVEGVGRAFAGPGAYWYAKKAGIEAPTEQTIKNALQGSLFHFPSVDELNAPPKDGATAPAPEAPQEQAPADQAPADQAPADQAPTGQAPPEQAPPATDPEAAVQAAEGAGQIVTGAAA